MVTQLYEQYLTRSEKDLVLPWRTVLIGPSKEHRRYCDDWHVTGLKENGLTYGVCNLCGCKLERFVENKFHEMRRIGVCGRPL